MGLTVSYDGSGEQKRIRERTLHECNNIQTYTTKTKLSFSVFVLVLCMCARIPSGVVPRLCFLSQL